MTISVLIVFIFVGALVLKLQLKNRAKFFPKRPLTDSEQILYWVLQKALPSHIILAQVSFSRLLYAKGGSAANNFRRLAQARQKVADYVICDKTFYVVAVVELDDASHNAEKDRARDEILKEAGLKIIRWRTTKLPTNEEIRQAVAPHGA